MTPRHLTVLMIGLLVAVPRAQSLADIAKKTQDEQAARAADKAAQPATAKKTTFTDKDLKAAPAPALSPAGTTATASADPLPPSPEPNVLQKMRADATGRYAPDLAHIRDVNGQLVASQQKYLDACAGKKTVATTPIVGPFGIVYHVPVVTENETTPECRAISSEISTQARELVDSSETMKEDARTRAIYPGVVRDLLESVNAPGALR